MTIIDAMGNKRWYNKKWQYHSHFIPLKINKDIILTKELIAKIKTRIIFS